MTEWKPQKGSKTISFKPQNLTESTIENSSSNDAIQEAPKNSQVKTFNPKPKEYKEEVEENIETAEETKSSHEDPYLKFKQNIPKKLIEPPKKKEKVVLDHPPPPKENPFIKKTKSGFAPKKAAQVYEAPDVQLNGHQNDNDNNNENQSKKPSFLDLQNEEKKNLEEEAKRNNDNVQKKSFFDSIIEQEKKVSKKSKPQTNFDQYEDDEPVKPKRKSGFKPKQAQAIFDGVSIEETVKKSNNSNSSGKKSAFDALLESEKETSEKLKAEREERERIEKLKELERKNKPSIIDMLIAEEKKNQNQKIEQEIEYDDDEEKGPTLHAFKPTKVASYYEAPSLEEVQESQKPKTKPSFTEILNNQAQTQQPINQKNNQQNIQQPNNNRNVVSTAQIIAQQQQQQAQQQAIEKQKQEKEQKKRGLSFTDLINSEQKQKPKATIVINSVKEENDQQVRGFNPKKSDTPSSFSDLINKERNTKKAAAKKQQSKHITFKGPAFKPPPQSAKKINAPSFAQLLDAEVQREEVANSPAAQAGIINPGASFLQKMQEEELKANNNQLPITNTIGDLVSYHGELPKKQRNGSRGKGKRKEGKKNKQSEDLELFWGTLDDQLVDEYDSDDDGNWPAFNQPKNNKKSTVPMTPEEKKKEDKISWLSQVLEEEIGEEDPREFAESLSIKSKPEMIRFLSTVTFDQFQASNIAERFFRRFSGK
ncbi:hypothetical protein TRFO_07589 [Tritrichomonas foetus]|uniref:Uncharacterized protein n=1 Tax=Tritrichomonas foetus TaxID=1144522 RepID=A0A1J4JQF8_9EUKA|nr:hypothetical protein TRFO_07589 [Tritrichomonas foetus]|eukprot:OHT01353.1 hypothetical protein TRFO_07589 [Tritrichomonas foetus]